MGHNMGCGVFSLLLRSKSGAFWYAPPVYPLTQWLGAAAGAGCARVLPVSLGGLWKNFLFFVAVSSRCSHLEIWTWPSPMYLSVLVYGCCLWSTAYGFSGRVRHLVQQWIHVYKWLWTNFSIFYVAVNFNPEAFVLHSV